MDSSRDRSLQITDSIDLHLHTNCSDGTATLEELVAQCAAAGLKAISVTDHDTLGCVDAAPAVAKKHGLTIIPGVEISAKDRGKTVHLLAYFLEGPREELHQKLAFLRQARVERNTKILAKLRELGVDAQEADLLRIAGKATLGRPHIARLLMEKGKVRSIQEAFDRFLVVGGLAYFPKEELPLKEAIELIHRAGGVAAVAHPLRFQWDRPFFEEVVREWISWGLDGLEVFYSSHSDPEVSYLQKLCKRLGLLMTGGSDFHGANKPDIKVRYGFGGLHVPGTLLEPLMQRKDVILNEVKDLRHTTSKEDSSLRSE